MKLSLPKEINSRNQGRLEKILDYSIGVIQNSLIILNNRGTKVEKVDFIGIDSSLNHTAAVFSLPYKVDDSDKEGLYNLLDYCNTIFSQSIAYPDKLASILKRLGVKIPSYAANYDLELFVKFFFKNLFMFYDNINERLIVMFKIHWTSKVKSENVKILYLDTFFFFILKNVFQIVNIAFKFTYIKSQGLDLSFLTSAVNKNLTELNTYTCIPELEISKRALKPVFIIEEINDGSQFHAIKTNSMAFGTILNVITKYSISRYLNSTDRWKALVFSVPKTSLSSFVRNSLKGFTNAVKLETKRKIDENKIDQIKLTSIYSNYLIEDDDKADAFCLTLYGMNLYSSIVDGLRLLLKTNLIELKKEGGIYYLNLNNLWEGEQIDLRDFNKEIHSVYKELNKLMEKYFYKLNSMRTSLKRAADVRNIW